MHVARLELRAPWVGAYRCTGDIHTEVGLVTCGRKLANAGPDVRVQPASSESRIDRFQIQSWRARTLSVEVSAT